METIVYRRLIYLLTASPEHPFTYLAPTDLLFSTIIQAHPSVKLKPSIIIDSVKNNPVSEISNLQSLHIVNGSMMVI